MADICDSCAFEDACPSAHFNKTESSICAFYKSLRKDKLDGAYWREALKDGKAGRCGSIRKKISEWLGQPGNGDYYSGYDAALCAVQDLIADTPTLTQPPITGDTSDGYHTFNELYHHRAILFSVICNERPEVAWKSKWHHDGTMYDGMFIVGIDTPEGQATYHYDIDPYWNLFRVKELELAPEWDGHTSGEAIRRIGTLTPPNEWVSVDERLPEYNPGTGAKSYWVAKKDNAGNWQIKIAQYCDYGYAMTVDAETEVTWRDWDFTKIVNVTHWMPLPEPPGKEG